MKPPFLITLLVLCFSLCVKAQDNNERLYQAIIKKEPEKVAQLLKDKADANYIKTMGPWMKVNMLISAVNSGELASVKTLVDHKADINWKDGFNTTALIYAANKGNQDMVLLLLSNGADIKASDGQGNTVLSAATESKNTALVKLIQERLKTAN